MTESITVGMCNPEGTKVAGLTNVLLHEAVTLLLQASAGSAPSGDCVRVATGLSAAMAARAGPIAGAGGVKGASGRPGKWYRVVDADGDARYLRGVPAVAKMVGRKAGALSVGLARGGGKWTSSTTDAGWFVREANAAEIARAESQSGTEGANA